MKIDIQKINVSALNGIVPKNGFLREREFIEINGEENSIKASNGIEELVLFYPCEFKDKALLDFEKFKGITLAHKNGIAEIEIDKKVKIKLNNSNYVFPKSDAFFKFEQQEFEKVISINGLELKEIIKDVSVYSKTDNYLNFAKALFLISENNKATFLGTDRTTIYVNETDIPYKNTQISFEIESLSKILPLLKDEEIEIFIGKRIKIKGNDFEFTSGIYEVGLPRIRKVLNECEFREIMKMRPEPLLEAIQKISFLTERKIHLKSNKEIIKIGYEDSYVFLEQKTAEFDFYLDYTKLISILKRIDEEITFLETKIGLRLVGSKDWLLSKMRD